MTRQEQVNQLKQDWKENDRWEGIIRPYTANEVVNLRGSVQIEHTLGKKGAEKFWEALKGDEVVSALGALTGNQAIQEVQAGLKAVYCSGWQVAGDANSAGAMYPDQSLYPVDSVPKLVERINNALLRTDEIHWMKGDDSTDWLVPLIADAEAGFGGNLNAFELMKAMIKAGAAAVHWEDQLSSAKKCGHMGGKVLVSTQEAINKLVAARLAADVLGVPSVIIARTDANAANLITTDNDIRDQRFVTGERSSEGFYYVNNGLDQAIDRGLSYAPYADLLWCETAKPNLDEARRFAMVIHEKYPGKLLCYNCSPSFNWKANLDEAELKSFRGELFKMGYKYQFITLAGWHALNLSMFELSRAYKAEGMYAYSNLQNREFDNEENGFRAAKHQAFVGTGYFDVVQNTVTAGNASTVAMEGSTEEEQFHSADPPIVSEMDKTPAYQA
ncbi:MAG: isocitrate lyase [Candidatus Marinimicrobia bacterium]|jgi:isocitrate lyase|nr:isocitrate lyase [Candidatus Neomarinimicrobiota bacterium]MDP6611871.1 isocitrate lyase [Candidatus Neomarinimicrobiota bacterium]|tara:strand:- start:1125 stop:2456 length:1332 start_codon:yes stop_codon:yes gene_type:complete